MSVSSPLVSVIIPTYNRADYLRQAVQSVKSQSYQPIEVIVVDHSSSDHTDRVIASFQDVKSIRLERTSTGLSASTRNAGVNAASGELIAFLDDDDLWEPHKVQSQVRAMKDSGSILVSCNAAIIDAEGEPVGAQYFDTGKIEGDLFAELLGTNFIICSSVLTRLQAVRECGGFSEDPGLRGLEDYHLWLRLALKGSLLYLPEALVRYRRHPGSIGSMNPHKALHARRRALRALLSDPQSSRRRGSVLVGIARDYARSALITLRRSPRR